MLALVGDSPSTASLAYAVALDVTGGLVLAVFLIVGALLWQRRLGQAVIAVGLIGLSWQLNAPIFEGPWIKSQTWMPAGRLVAISIVGIGVYLGIRFIGRLFRRPLSRWFVALPGAVALLAVFSLANLGWGPFSRFSGPAYDSFRMELTVLGWAAGVVALSVITHPWRSKRLVHGGISLLVVAAAISTSIYMRGADSIHRIRAEVRNSPYAATSRLMGLVEGRLLEHLRPLPKIRFGTDGVELKGLDEKEATAAQLALDELAPRRRNFNVIWIAIDSLRADHLGCYGYGRKTSPNIDAFAAKSVQFERNTTPSPASNMAYSATLNGIAARISPACFTYFKLPIPTPDGYSIPDVLRQTGRLSLGITAFWKSVQSRPDFATMAMGFDEFNADGHNNELNATQVTDLALTSIQKAKRDDRPFFCFIHYIDPHAPYDYHPEYSFDNDRTALGAYDSEIAYADAEIGRLLAALDEQGLSEQTVIALFADHGESFGEHNAWRHGSSLFEHQAHVPLIIHVPGLAPRSIRERTSLIDLGPTTIALMGYEDPFERIGRDLTPLMVKEGVEWQDYSYAERPNSPNETLKSKECAVWYEDLKLIWDPENNTYEVYDLSSDPNEAKSIFDPSDPRQGSMIGLMRSLDNRIDSHWGTARVQSKKTETASPHSQLRTDFSIAVSQLEAAVSNQELESAVGAIAKLMQTPALAFNRERQDSIGPALVDRLTKACENHLEHGVASAKNRDLIARFLVFTSKESSFNLLRQVREATNNEFVRQLISVHFALWGDESMRDGLEKIFPYLSPTEKITVAAALAHIGSTVGRDMMRGALWSGRSYDAVRAAEGLADLGDTQTLLDFLMSPNSLWSDARVQESLLSIVLTRSDSLAKTVVLTLANSGEEQVSRKAAEAVNKVFPGVSPEQLRRAYGFIFQAYESVRYASWENAVSSVNDVSELDAKIIGPYWLMIFRSAWMTGDRTAMESSLRHLEETAADESVMKEVVARLKSSKELQHSTDPTELGLTVVNVQMETEQRTRKSSPVLVNFELRNDSEEYILGSGAKKALYLTIGLKNSDGEFEPWVGGQPLDFEGLLPGESVRFQLWQRLPRTSGAYEVHIVAIRGDTERTPAFLGSAGTIQVE